MTQINLFTGTLHCDYCGGGSAKPGEPDLWHGFQDLDTGQLVCRGCRDEHYVQKARKMGTLKKISKVNFPAHILEIIDGYIIERMSYSEMPVIIPKTK